MRIFPPSQVGKLGPRRRGVISKTKAELPHDRQPGYLLILKKTRGFPSPPRNGFGFFLIYKLHTFWYMSRNIKTLHNATMCSGPLIQT